jgi:hypothetical protein
VTVRITWRQALAWRMRRQLLDPVASLPPEEVVRRLAGVQSQVASSAELAIRLRQHRSLPGEVADALADGRLIKTWAMRGPLHLLTPEEAGDVLALLATKPRWELPSWQRYFEMTPSRWELYRRVVRDALAEGPLNRQQVGAAVARRRELRHLAPHFGSSWGALFLPLSFLGDISVGPIVDGRPTLQLLSPNRRWPGRLPDADEAAPRVLRAYFRVYGPATVANVSRWLIQVERKRLTGWMADLGDDLVEIELDGERASILRADLDELATARPSSTVRLLPGFDQYVLAPGTDDAHVIPPGRRPLVSRQAGWISPVVLRGGVVAGTWSLKGDEVTVDWFPEAGAPPKGKLAVEVRRLARILARDLNSTVRRV